MSGDNELYLETSCTQKLFGGEAGFLLKMKDLLDAFAIQPQVVICDRPEWAKALCSRYDFILPPGRSKEVLYSLPVERLLYCGNPAKFDDERKAREELILFLKKVGFPKISDFVKLEGAHVAKRFGKTGLLVHQWVRGERELLLPPFVPSEPIIEWIDTEEISSLEGLIFYLKTLLVKIEHRLWGRSLLAKEITFTFFLESRSQLKKKLKLSEPLGDANTLLRIIKEFLSKTEWDAPLHRLQLELTDVVPWVMGQMSLFDTHEVKFSELSKFVSRLRVRCGEKVVGTPFFCESYFPERSWQNVWPPSKDISDTPEFPERPLFLYDPPRPCFVQKRWEYLPSENLDCEWWENKANRKYFVATTEDSEQLWVFFDELKQQWFLHGVFD